MYIEINTNWPIWKINNTCGGRGEYTSSSASVSLRLHQMTQLEHMNTECTLTKYRISRFKLICCRAAVEEGAEASATPLRHPGRAPPPAAAEGAQVCLRNAMYKHDTRNLHRLPIFPHPFRHRCAQVQVGISYYVM